MKHYLSFLIESIIDNFFLKLFQLAGQIDMNMQSDLMAAFEESL